MNNVNLLKKSDQYLNMLCCEIKERCVGSEGNRQATYFVEKEFSSLGWKTEMPAFDAIDWKEQGASLKAGDANFKVLAGPYSLGFNGSGELLPVSTVDELENCDAQGRILLLHGEIAQEQLMPKNFVFYNPENHKKIISLLEKSGARAIISATGRNSALAGGAYPFPLIEDGDFNIPNVYMTDTEGEKLIAFKGKIVFLDSFCERIPGKGYNVIALKGVDEADKIVITAHVDAKKGTQGAIDNATGVIVLLLLADLLKNYSGKKAIELVAFNGEDYYAVPGQMNYIASRQAGFKNTILNINIDGAGYMTGSSAFSLFDLPSGINESVQEIIRNNPGIEEGEKWPQGDHSIFLQFGIPALAVSSKWFIDNMSNQDITHTPKDNPAIVDVNKLIVISHALNDLVRQL
jgi:aminopeptidase YwaD